MLHPLAPPVLAALETAQRKGALFGEDSGKKEEEEEEGADKRIAGASIAEDEAIALLGSRNGRELPSAAWVRKKAATMDDHWSGCCCGACAIMRSLKCMEEDSICVTSASGAYHYYLQL